MAGKKPKSTPGPIEDALLGTITYSCSINPQLDEYTAEVELEGHSVELRLYTDDELDVMPAVRQTRDIIERYPAIADRARRYVRDHVVPLYNEVWRVEDEPELDANALMGHLTLEEITTHPGSKATFWYDAGDLFGGHILQLFMGDRKQFVDHDIAG